MPGADLSAPLTPWSMAVRSTDLLRSAQRVLSTTTRKISRPRAGREVNAAADAAPTSSGAVGTDRNMGTNWRAGASLARQYDVFSHRHESIAGIGAARSLIDSVGSGSIDISFVPDLSSAAILAMPLISDVRVVSEFAGHLRWLFEKFQGAEKSDSNRKDCDDAINIVKPTANHGGTQTFNVYNGPVLQQIVAIDVSDARRITEEAVREKARLQSMEAGRRERVSMVWKRLDRDRANQRDRRQTRR